MKKITLTLILFCFGVLSGFAQCINTSQWPQQPQQANNTGAIQTITTCAYTTEFSAVNGLEIGGTYTLVATNNDTQALAYITVTDLENNVILFGPSPLELADVQVEAIRLHYTSNAECDGESICHTATLQAVVACPPLSGILVNEITIDTATATWTAGPNDQTWEVLILPSTDPAPTEDITGVVSDAPTFEITELAPSTSYRIYVRGNCGDALSLWIQGPVFVTDCLPIEVPYFEDFESLPTPLGTNVIPVCWTEQSGDWLSSAATTINTPFSGTNFLRTFNFATNDLIWTGGIQLEAGTSYDFSFRVQGDGFPNWVVASFVGTDQNSASAEQLGENYIVPGNSNTASIQPYGIVRNTFIPNETGIYFFGIRVNQPGFAPTGIAFDDISIDLTPSCLAPTSLVVESGSLTATSVTIAFTEPSTTATSGYEYFISAENTEPDSAATASGTIAAGSTSVEISELEPQTTYYVWIRSVCSASSSSAWSSLVTFKTNCIPVTELPYIENFDSVTPPLGTNARPDCWFEQNGDWATTNETSFNTAFSGANYLRNAWTAANEFMWTGGVQLEAGTSYDFTFQCQGDGFAGWVVDVFVGNEQNSATATQFGNTYNVPGNATTASIQPYNLVRNTFVPTESGVYFFGIRVNQPNGAPWYVAFDDVTIDLTPACVSPAALAVEAGTLTDTSASISFVEPVTDAALGYEYFVDTTNTTPDASATPTGTIPAGSTSFEVNELEPNTVYFVWVRSLCSSSAVSDWSSPVSFKTQCSPVTELPYIEDFENLPAAVGTNTRPDCWLEQNGDWATSNETTYNTAYSGTNYLRNAWSAANEFMWTGGIQLQAGTSYDFTFQCQGDGYAGWVVDVFVGSEQNSASATQFGETYNVPGTANVASIQPYNLVRNTFVPTETGVYYFGIRVNQPSFAPWYVAFDDVTVELTPSCVSPSGLTVEPGTLTANSVNIFFTEPVTTANAGYEYYLAESNANPDDTVTPTGTVAAGSTLIEISDLSPLTTYYVWVRSLCSATEKSGWSSFVSFTTACAATELPWTEGFEGIANGPALPACWLEQNGDYTISNETTYNTALSGTSYLRIAWSATNEFVWTPGFELTAGTTYDFSFSCQGDGFTGWVMDTFVSQTQNSADAIQLGESYSPPGEGVAAIQQYEQLIRSFTPETTGIYYFGIRTNQPSGAPWYAAFDDFSVSESLSVNNPNENTALKVYPNPVKDVLNLKYNTNISNVAVFNIIGQQVLTQEVNAADAKVDMSKLAAGTYVVKVTADNMTKTMKVIKN